MRGYPYSRFADKAAIYYGGELRLTARANPLGEISWLKFADIDWMQFVVFGELGRVSDDYKLDEFVQDLKWDVGLGFRFMPKRRCSGWTWPPSDEGMAAWAMWDIPFSRPAYFMRAVRPASPDSAWLRCQRHSILGVGLLPLRPSFACRLALRCLAVWGREQTVPRMDASMFHKDRINTKYVTKYVDFCRHSPHEMCGLGKRPVKLDKTPVVTIASGQRKPPRREDK